MAYAGFLIRRLLQAIPVIFGVTFIVFWLIHLVPGDPARTALGLHATPAAIAKLHQEWGLDSSLPAQYLNYLGRLVTGNLGTSLRYQESAGTLILERLPVTLWLIVYSTVLVAIFAVPLALLAASRPGALRDRLVSIISVAGLGIPGFWLGLILIQYFAIEARVLPAAGFGSGFTGHLESMFLPSLTIAIGIIPMVVRSLRAEVLRTADLDFVVTARSKGLSERRIRWRHVLRNALPPSVTILMVNVGFLIGSTIVVELVFSLGGIGSLMINAINGRDFPLVQAVTLFFAFMVIFTNILGDLLQALLDPRLEAR
ncbi:MAG: ABC transporter permease [Actinobacteria bacterium]|nr:ABC transporter permease [Actinomycetota bacterium]